jgi:uncharacterized protein YjbK
VNQEIEIEFKNLLNNKEFNRLMDAFSLNPSQFISQTNHYFDTEAFSLKAIGTALRIRVKEGKCVLTLKEPHTDGLLETHQSLSDTASKSILETGRIPEGPIKQRLHDAEIPVMSLKHLGSLTTKRAEMPYKQGVIMLDHSTYLDTEDFECEYEAIERTSGEKIFKDLLNFYNIPLRQTPNKIQRFFNQKIKEESLHE